MKKILLPLFLITASMGAIRLSAYCAYNYSNDESITIKIFEIKYDGMLKPRTTHKLRPKGNRACWNWKEIDKSNRKKLWYWRAYSQDKRLITIWTSKLGEGYFPIGGAILFFGFDENARAKFEVHYDSKPWKYTKHPWILKARPWRTYKR